MDGRYFWRDDETIMVFGKFMLNGVSCPSPKQSVHTGAINE
ncbi:hypothetical protein [Moraxella lacunata]